MKSLSFCTTCKGRIWQLKKTLPLNIKEIKKHNNIDIIILDYNSDDGLKEYLFSNFMEDINNGLLKYYSLVENFKYFDMAFAKNIVHLLSSSDIVFNLDADNFIGDTIPELFSLKHNEYLVGGYIEGTSSSRLGRIGLYKDTFLNLRGYNEEILGLDGDDGELLFRLKYNNYIQVYSQDTTIPIQQTNKEKFLFDNVNKKRIKYNSKDIINKQGFGKCIVKDHLDNIIKIGIT